MISKSIFLDKEMSHSFFSSFRLVLSRLDLSRGHCLSDCLSLHFKLSAKLNKISSKKNNKRQKETSNVKTTLKKNYFSLPNKERLFFSILLKPQKINREVAKAKPQTVVLSLLTIILEIVVQTMKLQQSIFSQSN